MNMNKCQIKLICLLTALTMPGILWAQESVDQKYNGLMIAWARLPGGNTDGTPAEAPKPKPKPKNKPKQAETQPVVSNPVVPAAIESVPAPVKPAQKPVVKPEVVHVIKPKVQPVIKAVPPPVVKPVQVHSENPALANERNVPLSIDWLVGVGVDTGGEQLGTVTYADGSTAPVNANTGIIFNIGGVVKQGNNNPLSTQFSIGYKSGGPKLWSKDVNWTVIPIEVMENYQINSIRFGLGVSYQMNPQLKVDLPSSSSVSKYSNALGFVAQIGWKPVRDHYSIDLRYTSVKFQSSDVPSAATVDGSVAGLLATFYY